MTSVAVLRLRRSTQSGHGWLVFALTAGCASAPPPEVKPPIVHEESTLVVSPGGVTSVREMLIAADRRFDEGKYAEAEPLYLRAAELDVSGVERGRALLGAAVAADVGGRPRRALELYVDAERASGALRDPGASGAPLSRGRLFVRILRLATYLEVDVDLEARLASEAPRPGSLDALSVAAYRASRALERGDFEVAKKFLAEGEQIVSDLDLARLPRLPIEAAPFFLAKGRLHELRARELRFAPFPPNFPEVLEERCQLLLLAQSAYSDAMRAEDAAYSARAGLRIADLYESLHRDLVELERPEAANTQERVELLDAALRLRYEVLLDKAETMMSHTLAMIRRTGVDARYVADAERSLERLREARRLEEEALRRTGVPRSELERILRELEDDARRTTGSPPPSGR